jgi:hypothetical protein
VEAPKQRRTGLRMEEETNHCAANCPSRALSKRPLDFQT